MDASVKHIQVLSAAVLALIRPLARVLIRNGMTFKSFTDIAKRAFVEEGLNKFEIDGRKQTISRVAILTGLSRKEVQRVLNQKALKDSETHERYNRASWVVAGWVRDRDFLNEEGKPVSLPIDGNKSFSDLVRRYSGDVPARAVLDELLRVGVARMVESGHIKLVAYVPQNSSLDKIAILGRDVADLIETIDHNLEHGESDPYFQRKLMYDNVPIEAIAEFRLRSNEQSQALMESLDKWLSMHDRDVNPTVKGTGRMRVGIGIYYFEEDVTTMLSNQKSASTGQKTTSPKQKTVPPEKVK
jgi:Family of unknown function (DUF6502)